MHGITAPNYSYPVWTGDPPPFRAPTTAMRVPSVAEQMGTDPTSKLAAAIDRLATAMETWGGTRRGEQVPDG
jgi:hypothetical protein